jgi:hypothetical protein
VLATSKIEFDIVADNRPNSLLSTEEIIQQCRARALANAANSTSDIRGLPLVDESKDGTPCAWVKFGPPTIMAEARTQNYVAQAVNGDATAPVRVPYVYLSFTSHDWGYIVMEYIDGVICSHADARLIAAAVQFLVNVRAPTAQPGPIGGGPICHDFFIDRESSLTYSSVRMLENHVNGVECSPHSASYTVAGDYWMITPLTQILKHVGRPNRVRLGPEVEEHGLRLCLSDMTRNNFIKDRNNTIVAIDFGASCFLPVSFFDLALRNPDYFTQLLRARIRRSKSNQLNALLAASQSLAPFGMDKIGEHISLLSLFLARRRKFDVYRTGVPPELKQTAK